MATRGAVCPEKRNLFDCLGDMYDPSATRTTAMCHAMRYSEQGRVIVVCTCLADARKVGTYSILYADKSIGLRFRGCARWPLFITRTLAPACHERAELGRNLRVLAFKFGLSPKTKWESGSIRPSARSEGSIPFL